MYMVSKYQMSVLSLHNQRMSAVMSNRRITKVSKDIRNKQYNRGQLVVPCFTGSVVARIDNAAGTPRRVEYTLDRIAVCISSVTSMEHKSSFRVARAEVHRRVHGFVLKTSSDSGHEKKRHVFQENRDFCCEKRDKKHDCT